MDHLSILETYYRKYIEDLNSWLPEGIIDVNLGLLRSFNLLNYRDESVIDPTLTRYFQVIESEEKITLVNEDFVVWIVPYNFDELPTTYILIALNQPNHPKIELAYSTSGVYNTSTLVLRVLEKFLMEIEENERVMSQISKKNEK